jgi:hypothetical protein
MTAYSPSGDNARWLGDTIEEGLSNLLPVSIRDTGLTPPFHRMPAREIKALRVVNLRNARAVAAVLGLEIPDSLTRLWSQE